MTKPEPIPILRGKDALEFQKRLKNFKLDPSAKELYRDALKDYKARQKMNDDIRIRTVRVLGDRAKAEALNLVRARNPTCFSGGMKASLPMPIERDIYD